MTLLMTVTTILNYIHYIKPWHKPFHGLSHGLCHSLMSWSNVSAHIIYPNSGPHILNTTHVHPIYPHSLPFGLADP